VDTAHIIRLCTPFALCELFPQIRQLNISTVARNQILLSVLAGTPAHHARQAHKIAGIIA
jgi:hypothetical protein